MSRFAISSWSLDGMLAADTPLLEVPAAMAQHGITTLELCHFHLPSTEQAYLDAFRGALDTAGIELYTLLIDTGDVVAPDGAKRTEDNETIVSWIGVAAKLGAKQVRIAAGRQPATGAVIAQSAEQLRMLAHEAKEQHVGTITENWLLTSQQPDDLLAILDGCDGLVGLCADTGNAEATPDKYATLEQLLPRASSVHFKAHYASDGTVMADDAERCAKLMHDAHFDGVITLIYDKKQNEWQGITQLQTALAPLI